MISRELLLAHLGSLEGVRNPEEGIFILTIAWDGVERLHDVTVEVGEHNLALYGPVVNVDTFEIEELGALLEGVTVPEEFKLVIYEYFPPKFFWCLSFVSNYSDIYDIESFRSTVVLLANFADLIEAKISNEDVL